jgi:mRNA interferase MazF
MNVQRGDIVLVRFPFSSGTGGKVRPGLVVQDDHNSQRLANTILAAITSTTRRSHEPTQLLIDLATPEGKASGLLFDSAITCENLATVELRLIQRKIGTLPRTLMLHVGDCLKASLGL